jgi:hypothetical protein
MSTGEREIRDDMNADTGGSRRCKARLQRLVVVAVLTGSAVLAAACSGGSHTTVSSASSGQLTAPKLDAFAQCVRSHGVPNFYFAGKASGTGSGAHVFGYSIPAGINPYSSQFQAAMSACRHLVGGPAGPPPGLTAAQLRGLVKAAACVRAHGYPTFPDPTVHGALTSWAAPAGVDTSSPQFQSALRTCHADEG